MTGLPGRLSSNAIMNYQESDIRNLLKDYMDSFLTDYLKANPRKFVE